VHSTGLTVRLPPHLYFWRRRQNLQAYVAGDPGERRQYRYLRCLMPVAFERTLQPVSTDLSLPWEFIQQAQPKLGNII